MLSASLSGSPRHVCSTVIGSCSPSLQLSSSEERGALRDRARPRGSRSSTARHRRCSAPQPPEGEFALLRATRGSSSPAGTWNEKKRTKRVRAKQPPPGRGPQTAGWRPPSDPASQGAQRRCLRGTRQRRGKLAGVSALQLQGKGTCRIWGWCDSGWRDLPAVSSTQEAPGAAERGLVPVDPWDLCFAGFNESYPQRFSPERRAPGRGFCFQCLPRMRLASLRLLSAVWEPSSVLAYELSWQRSVSLTGPGLDFFI